MVRMWQPGLDLLQEMLVAVLEQIPREFVRKIRRWRIFQHRLHRCGFSPLA